ncbi:MAG: protein kinase, partial [Planctomycetota bacterium]|nr:protein kinase [Planctomycetota bacterium]
VLPIAIDAARGLQYAEKKGLIHRDIKPANLFLSKEEVTKIGDLGIAQRFATGATASQETVSGSPHYIAPEQALGKKIDQKVDLYALGVSMYEMFSGEVPYSGRSPQEIIMKHINEPVPELKEKRKDLPQALYNIVAALMEKDPDKRISTATQLISLLVPLLKDYPTRTTALIRLQADLSASSGRLGAASDSQSLATDTSDPILASLAGANIEEEESGPSIWPKLALALGAILLMSCMCIGLFSMLAQSKAEYAQREAQIASLEEALKRGDSVNTKKEATNLFKQWTDEDFPELAERAQKLADAAQTKIEETKKAEREEGAAKIYAALNGRVKNLRVVSKDEEDLRSLDKDLTAFIESYFDTVAADRARSDLIRVEKAIVRFKEDQQNRQEELAEFQRRSKACKASIEKKLNARRFSEAVDILSKYREKNPDPKYQAAARGFEQSLYAFADGMIKRIRREIMGIAAQGDYVKARREIDDNEKLVGLERYAKNFRALRKSIDDIEKAADARAAEDRRKADLAVFEKAFDEHVKAAARKRDFEKASQSLKSILVSLNVPEIAKEVRQKALLYGFAQKAIGTLVEHINSTKMKSGITRIFAHNNGEKMCVAVEAERFVLIFAADKRIQYPCRLEKLRPIEILDFFKALKPTPKTELYLSSLAWALGETDFARSHSQKLAVFSEAELEEGRAALRKFMN